MTKRKHTKGPALDRNGNKVIHVVFGPGGGRIPSETLGRISQEAGQQPSGQRQAGQDLLNLRGGNSGPDAPSSELTHGKSLLGGNVAAAALAGFTQSREPVTDVFTQGEIARLLGVSLSRLRTLDRSGIVTPSGRRQGRRAYTFADLIQLRAAQSLLSQQVRLRDVSRAIFALKKTLPRVARPLSELRIVSDGRTIVVRAEDGRFEPLSGQMLLDFDVKQLRDDVVRVLRPNAGRERSRTAYELYLRASQLDEDPETMNEAEELYRKAVELDPWLTIAFTNLGNICFRRQDVAAAEELYRQALDLDRSQPEAQYNLGYVMLERGNAAESIPLFQGAIDADPTFSDAYFNLAMAYEQNGESEKARPFWADYVKLEPAGTWTEIARRHL